MRIYNPDEQGEGEVQIKGRNVFMGYLKRDEETFKCFDSEGYFFTGDQGRIEEDGNLVITGRIKDLIITSGG